MEPRRYTGAALTAGVTRSARQGVPSTAPLGVTTEGVEGAGGAREAAGWREESLEGTAHAREGHAPRRASPGDEASGNVEPSAAWVSCARCRSRARKP